MADRISVKTEAKGVDIVSHLMLSALEKLYFQCVKSEQHRNLFQGNQVAIALHSNKETGVFVEITMEDVGREVVWPGQFH